VAETILVTPDDLADGARLIQELDKLGFPVTAAFWAYDPILETWRLIIAAPSKDIESLMSVYRLIQQIIEDAELTISLSMVSLIPDDDSNVRNLRALAESGTQDVIGTPIGSTEIAGRMFDEVQVYRHDALRYERMILEALQRIKPSSAVLRDAHRLDLPKRLEIDFLLDDGGEAVVIEAKLWSRPVSSKVVLSAEDILHRLSTYFQRLAGVIIVSRSGFTRAALDSASEDNRILLVVWRDPDDDDDLRQALNRLLAAT
jgi:hypothetical protein